MRKRLTIGFLTVWALSAVATWAQSPVNRPGTFQKVRLLVPVGDETQETEVTLVLDADQLVIRSVKGGSDLKAFPYTQIKSAVYSYSESPRRWKSGVVAGLAVGPVASPIFLMKGKKHWLTVKTDGDYVVLRLDKGNYKVILTEFATRSGVKVEAAGEEVKAVAKLGVGESARVTVKLRDLTEVEGNVSQAGEDTFVVRDKKSQKDKTIAYSEVISMKAELSTGANIAIGLTVGWWVFWILASFFI